MPRSRSLAKVLLLLVSTGAALALCEVLLRLFSDFPIHTRLANRVPDEILGYRMDPALGDIDEAGFRNANVLAHADIVAIGDSHTYGNNVRSEDAWPKQLGRMANRTVYNLGVGGYGPLQYSHLTDRALELSPSHIIIGLYFPNDLFDVCSLIVRSGYWQAWARERRYQVEACRATVAETADERTDAEPGLVRSTALGSASLYISDRLLEPALASWRAESPAPSARGVLIRDGRNDGFITRGRLNTQSRFMDLTKPDVATAFTVIKDITREAAAKAEDHGARLSVLFVPSKVSAHFEYLRSRGVELPPVYHRAVANESRLIEEFSTFCASLDMTCVDGRQYVAAALEAFASVYPSTADGHPTDIGYRAYAQAVFEALFRSTSTVDSLAPPR